MHTCICEPTNCLGPKTFEGPKNLGPTKNCQNVINNLPLITLTPFLDMAEKVTKTKNVSNKSV